MQFGTREWYCSWLFNIGMRKVLRGSKKTVKLAVHRVIHRAGHTEVEVPPITSVG